MNGSGVMITEKQPTWRRAALRSTELIGKICYAKTVGFPSNLKINRTLDDTTLLRKKYLTSKQWKWLIEDKLNTDYEDHHKIFTDTGKDHHKLDTGRTGISITDLRHLKSWERVDELIQISNAELIAILKAILSFKLADSRKVVILSDSLNGCDWLQKGLRNNYPVHVIKEQIERIHDVDFTIQWIPSHVGVHGNDEADDLANRGAWLQDISPSRSRILTPCWK